jgi:hypothetical protein
LAKEYLSLACSWLGITIKSFEGSEINARPASFTQTRELNKRRLSIFEN